MLYNVKTGRFAFEAADVMINTNKPTRKRNIIAVTETKLELPKAEAKTCDSLEKNLSEYRIKFSSETGRLFMKRIIGFREMLGYLKNASLYTAATLITVMLLYGSISAADIRFAHEAILDGEPVGIIANTDDFKRLVEDMRLSLSTTLGKEVPLSGEAVFIPRLIFGKSLTGDYKLRQNILSTFDEVAEAYAIYVDDKLICATLEEDAANSVLDRIKEKHIEDGVDMTVSFAENVSVRKEFIPIGFICSEDGAYAALNAPREEGSTYTVTANDTLWGIATKFGMTVEELFALNSGINETIHEGNVISIKKTNPLLSVKTAYVYEGERSIPFETTQTQDASLPYGNKKVVKEGVEGKKYVVEEIVKINGEVVASNIKSEKVLSEPVAAMVSIGTKKTLSSVAVSGKLARPVYGTISSRFGRRGRGNHKGLDIAAPTGTPIKAADGGTITYTGWESGYGYIVKISHGDGFETYYAHCSAILTSSGKKVSKGDIIAKVGNTGRSSGPHLHFEVRKNGAAQDPSKYIN